MNQTDALKLLLEDRKLFIETVMAIEDKNRQLVPFILNPIQADMDSTSTGRDVYVKPAQVGASSYFICDFLVDCLTIPGTTAVIISYDEFITGRLLRKAQVLYDVLKKKIPSIPELTHKSVNEKQFRGVNSSFYIASAKGFTMLRGEAIHDLLMDEFAFWPQGVAEEVFGASLQRVPLLESTKVIALSTPRSESDDFHELYATAKEGRATGGSTFKAHFYAWYQHPEYSMPYTSTFCLPGDEIEVLNELDDEEINLMSRFAAMGIDLEEQYSKIRWRRYKIAEMSSLRRDGKTKLLFGQEYPEDDVSCFQVAGDMWYDGNLITDMARKCYPAAVHNHFADIWYLPEDGVSYLIAIDPGMGITSQSVATVWQFTEDRFLHCATMSGYYKDYDMAAKSMSLAEYYNNGIIANEDALGISSHLRNYPYLYYRTDPVTGAVGKQIGWQTTKSSKPYMCNELSRHMSKIVTHDITFVSQLRNIRDVGGRPGSIGADDVHDSVAIAIVCRQSVPVHRGLVGSKGWPDGWGR